MNLIDTIINGEGNDATTGNTNTTAVTTATAATPATLTTPTAPAPVVMAGDHDFTKGALLSEDQRERLQTIAVQAGLPEGLPREAYRGRGVNVAGANNNPEAILNATGLNWRTGCVQLAMRGKAETRDIPGMKALVRSDSGAFLAVASDSYKPHHNSELVTSMSRWASDNGLTIQRAGQWDGGKRIWAVATSDITAEARVGDRFALQLVIRSGHEPGVATAIRAVAMRLVCSNGAWVNDGAVNVRWTHGRAVTQARLAEVRGSLLKWSGAFDRYMADMAVFYNVPLPRLAQRVFLADVIQPELITDLAQQLHVEIRRERRLGAEIVARILESDHSARVCARLLSESSGRLLRSVTQATNDQVGKHLDTDTDTLAHAYNGVTFFNSHLRGRDADAALESQLYGDGGRMAVAARAVGLDYARVLAPQAVQMAHGARQ